MEISGKIRMIGPTTQVSASFQKREVVIETEEQYKQLILIDFAQDKCDLLDNYRPGDDVKVSINLRGREWVNPQGEVKYFNSIQGWRIERTAQQQAPQQPARAQQQYQAPAQQFPPAPQYNQEDPDDLPF